MVYLYTSNILIDHRFLLDYSYGYLGGGMIIFIPIGVCAARRRRRRNGFQVDYDIQMHYFIILLL